MGETFCWLRAPAYSLQIGPDHKSWQYTNFTYLYLANFPGSPSCEGLAMDGYPESPTGYGANLQPALASAVDAGHPFAAEAWAKYQTRDPRQDYSAAPQFAVVPFSQSGLSARPRAAGRRGVGMRLEYRPGDPGLRIRVGEGAGARYYGLRGERLPARPR